MTFAGFEKPHFVHKLETLLYSYYLSHLSFHSCSFTAAPENWTGVGGCRSSWRGSQSLRSSRIILGSSTCRLGFPDITGATFTDGFSLLSSSGDRLFYVPFLLSAQSSLSALSLEKHTASILAFLGAQVQCLGNTFVLSLTLCSTSHFPLAQELSPAS